MSNISIKVENLSKAYQLGEIGTGTISRDLERWWSKLRNKPDPFLRIGEETSLKHSNDVFWSLTNINFEINQGDAVGIIGRNGAGKSTLLKILSKVTSATTGKISGKGRIASLLEVGTGFHPELTGRENIFLNGAILGMRKAEIKKHFDEIVDFSGVNQYIDTPVKRYSSGMYVRLAFAVAAHLESEILIVDEVLAVGDAEFQKKCLGKMGEVSKGQGRTVLFVSHNMGSVKQLCQNGIVLTDGRVSVHGPIKQCVDYYISSSSSGENIFLSKESKGIHVSQCKIVTPVVSGSEFTVEIDIRSDIKIPNPHISLIVKDESLNIITTFYSHHSTQNKLGLNQGETKIQCSISKLPLCLGDYFLDIWLSESGTDTIEYLENALMFSVSEDLFFDSGFISQKTIHGIINTQNQWRNV